MKKTENDKKMGSDAPKLPDNEPIKSEPFYNSKTKVLVSKESKTDTK